jgi:Vitamin K-dependent gamma-carboxylase
VPREALFNPSAWTIFYYATFAAGLAALVGIFTRVTIFLFALGVWTLVSHAYSYADVHHPEAVFAIFLMALAFSPAGDSLSVDAFLRRRRRSAWGASDEPRTLETAAWPLKLAHVLLSMTYFSTGATKLLSGGLDWMNGYTLQLYTFGDAVQRNLPLGIWLGQQHTLAILLSIFTIAFELFFFLSLFLPRAAPLFFINGIFFQLGLYFAAGHPFFPHIVLLGLLLAFHEPQWWRRWVGTGRLAGRARGPAHEGSAKTRTLVGET